MLYPPPPQRNYRTDSYEKFVFSVSRLHKLKRLDLLVDAFLYLQDKEFKAYIIGDGPEFENLSRKIREYKLENRIFLLGSTDEKMLVDYYARCRAVFFCPYHEDYGFVTPEAFASRKAVLTTADSGGPSELVQNGQTGFVVVPDPRIIAQKMDALAENKALAEKMGENAYQVVSKISWEQTVKKLAICS